MAGEASLRDSIEEAFALDEEETAGEGGQEEVELEAEEKLGDELEEVFDETVEEDVEGAKEDEAEAETGASVEDETDDSAETEDKPATDLKAPNSWRAEGRETWKDVPKGARAEIIRREREHDKFMKESAQHRNTAQEYQQVVEPYINNIRAEGVSAADAITNLLQTASQLQMGSALVKAQTITRLIGAYGVDIQVLSDVLTDKHQPSEQDKVSQEVERQVREQTGQQQTYQQQQWEAQQRETVKAETDAWSESAEFVKEVGPDMADLLEMAGRRGQSLSLDDAYAKACKLHPEVSKILAQREAAKAAKRRVKANKGKRRAGSSIKSSSASGGGASVPTTLRGALEEAYDSNVQG